MSIADFGRALAYDGDTLFVGAPASGNPVPTELQPWGGRVHVFQRDGEGWMRKQTISSIDPDASEFGARIAAEGGILVVGDSSDDSVYVYRREAQGWTADAKLNLDDDGLGLATAGGSIGISNGRVAVAELYAAIFAAFVGEPRMSVFERAGGSWVRTGTTLLPRDPQVPDDRAPAGFGMTGLVFAGRTVVVGAQYAPGFGPGVSSTINYAQTGATSTGAVYVFSETAKGWDLAAHVKASNPSAGDNFGSRVAMDGNTIVVSAASEDSSGIGVGAEQADENGTDTGAVYIFGIDCAQVPKGANVPGC